MVLNMERSDDQCSYSNIRLIWNRGFLASIPYFLAQCIYVRFTMVFPGCISDRGSLLSYLFLRGLPAWTISGCSWFLLAPAVSWWWCCGGSSQGNPIMRWFISISDLFNDINYIGAGIICPALQCLCGSVVWRCLAAQAMVWLCWFFKYLLYACLYERTFGFWYPLMFPRRMRGIRLLLFL